MFIVYSLGVGSVTYIRFMFIMNLTVNLDLTVIMDVY